MPKPEVCRVEQALHVALYVLGCGAGTLFVVLAYLESLLP